MDGGYGHSFDRILDKGRCGCAEHVWNPRLFHGPVRRDPLCLGCRCNLDRQPAAVNLLRRSTQAQNDVGHGFQSVPFSIFTRQTMEGTTKIAEKKGCRDEKCPHDRSVIIADVWSAAKPLRISGNRIVSHRKNGLWYAPFHTRLGTIL